MDVLGPRKKKRYGARILRVSVGWPPYGQEQHSPDNVTRGHRGPRAYVWGPKEIRTIEEFRRRSPFQKRYQQFNSKLARNRRYRLKSGPSFLAKKLLISDGYFGYSGDGRRREEENFRRNSWKCIYRVEDMFR